MFFKSDKNVNKNGKYNATKKLYDTSSITFSVGFAENIFKRNNTNKRIKDANMVIFLKYSWMARLKGILSRYFKLKGKEREEMPGCKEKLEWKFVKFTLNWNKKYLKFVNELLEKYKDKKIIVFKSRKKLNEWYEKEFGKKIEL